jgi:hypothetical protein
LDFQSPFKTQALIGTIPPARSPCLHKQAGKRQYPLFAGFRLRHSQERVFLAVPPSNRLGPRPCENAEASIAVEALCFSDRLEDRIRDDNPVRAIPVVVDVLDLGGLGFGRVAPHAVRT